MWPYRRLPELRAATSPRSWKENERYAHDPTAAGATRMGTSAAAATKGCDEAVTACEPAKDLCDRAAGRKHGVPLRKSNHVGSVVLEAAKPSARTRSRNVSATPRKSSKSASRCGQHVARATGIAPTTSGFRRAVQQTSGTARLARAALTRRWTANGLPPREVSWRSVRRFALPAGLDFTITAKSRCDPNLWRLPLYLQ